MDTHPTISHRATNASTALYPQLWRGLVGAWVPALQNGGNWIPNAASIHRADRMDFNGTGQIWETTASGLRGVRFANGTAHNVRTAADPSLFNRSFLETSVFVSFDVHTAFTTYDVLFAFGNWGPDLYVSTDSLPTKLTYTDSRATFGTAVKATGYTWLTTPDGQQHSVAARTSTARSRGELWVDGVDSLVYDTFVGGALTMPPATEGISFGSTWNAGTTQTSNARIAVVLLWERYITPWEIRLLHRDPVAPFRLRPLRVPYAAAAAPAGPDPHYFYFRDRLIETPLLQR